jgi:hypothetical protein
MSDDPGLLGLAQDHQGWEIAARTPSWHRPALGGEGSEGFLTATPAEAALKRGEALPLLAGGLALLIFLLARGFSLLALRSYTSASS